jgi:hypothetical protein
MRDRKNIATIATGEPKPGIEVHGKDCKGWYVPWICGFCQHKKSCNEMVKKTIASLRRWNA